MSITALDHVQALCLTGERGTEWQRFVDSISHATHNEFEEKLKELAVALHKQGSFLDVKLTKVVSDTLEVPCLAVFASQRETAKAIRRLRTSELPPK